MSDFGNATFSPDWLLIWDQNDEELTLLFIDTGSHSDVFG